ncbi:protein FAM83H isoform 1-T2 [Menidia menidia]
MARRSQCSSAGDNPLDPNYLPPHYREEYRLAIDALIEEDVEGYYQFLLKADVVDFLSDSEIRYIQNSVQAPKQSGQPELHFLDRADDGSSDTYWPIHSDQEVPGLDLGWPQMHPFIGPTEVITLINPPEPDMPSIKEQARRLIKNAQQVVAVVMDVFTDVDMFADILNAAQRSVAVYVLLDEQNAHRFVNMAANCRVDLQSIPFLCVRTVGGITYQCRTGKSLKGQMMDRFLLTDCRAVLSGNYSFMWSFEKLHRCMAHLFLGQLVTTFDEEFRILFAQSQPLVVEPAPAPVEDLGLLHKRQYPNERVPLYREPRTFLSVDQTDERGRHSYDERQEGDWRMMALKRQESLRGPADIYSRLSAQQSRADPCFDQGPSRIAMLENPSLKRHSYAEGAPGKYSFLQQGMPDSEPHLKHFYRGQQPYQGPGPDVEYSGYEKFRNPDYHPSDQYPEPGLPQDAQLPETFDPVLNYLSSTRNLDFEQSSHMADLPFSSSHQRRLSLDQPHVFQTSPTPSNSADQKPFLLDPAADRKDPTVKQGLRNWRISSYLSAYENPREEGLPVAPDVFEEPPNPMQKIAPGTDVSAPKIPNVREFKVSTINRVSQMPSYAKTASREQPKKLLDEPSAAGADPKRTPTPSELSSSTEGEKTEEAEQKEPKSTVLRREDSFKRNYNAALQRSSRLRSSLIFSSLDQQQSPQEADQQDEPGEKNEAAHTKTPFVSHVLGQRRPATREPIEWSKYIKPATFDGSSAEASKADDGEAVKREDANDAKDPGAQDPLKPAHVKQDSPQPATPQPKLSEAEMAKTDQPFQPPKPFMPSQPFIDMNDPDNRLMFFKELAAKRKAEKRKEEEARAKLPAEVENAASCQKTEPPPKETSESEGSSENTGPAGGVSKATEASLFSDVGQHTRKREGLVDEASHTPQSCGEHGDVDSRLDTGLQTCPSNPAEECRPFGVESGNPPPVSEAIDERDGPKLVSASEESVSVISSSVEVPSSLASEVETQNPDSEPDAESSTPIQLRESSCDQTPLDSGSQISPSSPRGTLPSDTVKEDSISDYCPSMKSPNGFKTGVQASVSPLRQTSSQSFEETSGGLTPLDSAPQSAPDTTHLGSDITVTEENYKKHSATTPSAEAEESEAVGSFKDNGTDSVSLHLGPESGALLGASVSEPSSASATAKSPTQPPVSETTGSLFSTDFPSNAAQLETPASPLDSPRHSALPHHFNLTGPDGLRTEASDQSLSPQAEKALADISALDGVSDKNPPSSKTGPESEESPSGPAEPASEASAELDLPCRTAESPAPAPCTSPDGSRAEDEVLDTDQSRPDKLEVKADEPARQSTAEPADAAASKQAKSGQCRYHSSTANVISSSNLRDDTKLLLEQISANCQSRSESTKESPVTDDEKEDEADKHAQKEKERGFRALSRGQPKSSQEREKLLERIQCMRKERKVYSRFEMAP